MQMHTYRRVRCTCEKILKYKKKSLQRFITDKIVDIF